MGKYIIPTAETCIDLQLKNLDAVLAFFDQEVRERLNLEVDSLRLLADRFDRHLDHVIEQCAAAKKPEEIGQIFRKARGDVIEFLYSTTLTISVLRLAIKTRMAEAYARGYRSAGDFLSIEQNKLTIQDAVNAIKPENERPTLSLREVLALSRKIILVPSHTSETVRIWSAVSLNYARAQKKLFSASTSRLRLLLLGRLWRILWGLVQQYWGIVFALACALLLGVIAWALGLAIPGVIFAAVFALLCYPLQWFLERVFKRWHLRRYGRICVHTLLDLYLAQIIARASVIGLQQIAEKEPTKAITTTQKTVDPTP
jgi:hypothetical protein